MSERNRRDWTAETSLSPYNEENAGRSPSRVYVADCTLRDGEQQAGLVFSPERKVKIARALADLGIYEIEAGTPAVSKDDRDAVEAIAALPGVKVSALSMSRKRDIDLVASTGVWGIRVSLPAGALQMKYKLGISETEYVEQARTMTEYAKGKGLYVIFSPYDTTRSERGFLERMLKAVTASGAVDRLRLVDTVGCATPTAIQRLVEIMRESSAGVPIEVHVHDDFGLATANTVAGVLGGAEYVSTSMISLGERSGNAATEQVVVALELLYGIDTGVCLERLTESAALVSAFSGVALPPNTPVVGSNSFTHESGLVTAGVLREPFTGEPYRPGLVGQRRRIIAGKMSGSQAVRSWLMERGRVADDLAVDTLLEKVKARAAYLERALTDDEVETLAVETLAAEP
jgi:isopropylmalate/homocitrate/citramalate synthase